MRKNLQRFIAKNSSKVLFWLVLAVCQLTYHVGIAQDRQIKGTVVSSDDKAGIPGVSIRVKGGKQGTNSDMNGQFSLTTPSNGILEFSMVGYKNQEVKLGSQSVINVVLEIDARQLQEVVVTALGIKKDVRRIGVAIQSVDGSATIKAREPNAINALSGRVAGLTIGSQPELLRKPNISLRGSSTVLYVVDGVPINSDTWNISPDDIETYSVLKGASASALYGFRGKNGAILITTKRGTTFRGN